MPYLKYTSFTFTTKLGSHFGHTRALLAFLPLLVILVVCTSPSARAQDSVTGAFIGYVHDANDKPLAGAVVQFLNKDTNAPRAKITDSEGRFYQGLLNPGTYEITVTLSGFITVKKTYSLAPTRDNQVIPVPITLVPEGTPTTATTGTTTTTTTTTGTGTAGTTGGTAGSAVNNEAVRDDSSIQGGASDARRGGAYTQKQVHTLPLGGTTLVRSFDELALLLPGIASPPQSEGGGTGPGVGAGVGTSGQFSVNGLRSRANNFMVDGSDNNDEDIGVRRQGFFTLVPQSIESIREFTVISLLAPAQYGRNFGAQVNAVSRSGGNQFHGTFYGMYNSNQLNAPNYFDTVSGNTSNALTVGGRPVLFCPNPGLIIDTGSLQSCPGSSPISVRNSAGQEDTFSLGQGGFVLGGPIVPNKLFFFVAAEGQHLSATKESNFAVPTVAQRGLNNSGATGQIIQPFAGPYEFPFMSGLTFVYPAGRPNYFYPTTLDGDRIFSLFPFPNNPAGVYGGNTFTQALPAGAAGTVVSGKLDYNFKYHERQQSFTGRYNFTDDRRDLPVTGGALFSSLRARVQTQNFSTYLNSELSGPNSTAPVFNQLRLSYGRTRLAFDESRDSEFLLPSNLGLDDPTEERFLLNSRYLANYTLPNYINCINPLGAVCAPGSITPSTGPILYAPGQGGPIQNSLGPIGQVKVAGFSSVGVDVYNFPQGRVNNTYQLADTVTWRRGAHSFSFGTDIRRTELNSALPRNSRPLVTFLGAPRSNFNLTTNGMGTFSISNFNFNGFVSPLDLVSAGAPSGYFQSLKLPGTDDKLDLRYYQFDFFAQDEWRIRPTLSLSYGLRYEINTPPTSANNQVESTFASASLSLAPNFRNFIGGRTKIFDPDHNNFAPRIGLAWSPDPFGREHSTIIRAGYGLYYDQILGAVVSQSRNVFPTYLTVNVAGGLGGAYGGVFGSPFEIRGPYGICANPGCVSLLAPGTINTLNPALTLNQQVNVLNQISGGGFISTASALSLTLPQKETQTPMAHQFSVSFEQELNRNLVVSAAYVGTRGRDLLRVTTPNLGANSILVPLFTDPTEFETHVAGAALQPGSVVSPTGIVTGGRPLTGIGAVTIYTTTANSDYDSLQVQARGRMGSRFQYQLNYTWSKAQDDASDVFDLAGASALPQNSRTFAGEYGPSNFDVQHRFAYNFIYELPSYSDRDRAYRWILGGLQISGTGRFQTGQPFTVNSIYDVNLDGNLTDRLNNTNAIRVTGDREHPLALTGSPLSMFAAIGQDGAVGRNTFRAGSVMELDLSLAKWFPIGDGQRFGFRMDIFNFTNRANFGVPVRFLGATAAESPGFGSATDTVTPGRRIQFSLKYDF